MFRFLILIVAIYLPFSYLPIAAQAMGSNDSIYDENFYFYKVEGQKLKRSQDYGSYDFPQIRKVYPGFPVNALLPKNYARTPERIGFTLSFPVKEPDERYRLQIEQLRLRSKQQTYKLIHSFFQRNVTPSHPSYNWQSSFEVIDGIARMKHPFEIDQKHTDSISFGIVENNPPKEIYLDYKIRIQRVGQEERVFEGTISMERKSYVPARHLLQTEAYWREQEKVRKEGKVAQ